MTQVLEGHVYSIRFGDGFHAKILVTRAGKIRSSRGVLSFDWVFQRNQTPSFVSSFSTSTPVPSTAIPIAPPLLFTPSPPSLAAPLPGGPGEPSIYLHGTQTQVTLGQPVRLDLSVVNSIGRPDMTVQLILRVPSGWTLSGAGFVESCTGQCTSVYEISAGGNRSIQLNLQPNQDGAFMVQGRLEWFFGGDTSTLDGQNLSLPITVEPQ